MKYSMTQATSSCEHTHHKAQDDARCGKELLMTNLAHKTEAGCAHTNLHAKDALNYSTPADETVHYLVVLCNCNADMQA